MEKVFVCAGMNLAKNENINKQAEQLGYLLAQRGVEYVQGGTDQGLMGVTLKAFLQKSKNVSFLIPSAYYDYDAPNLIKLVGEKYFRAEKMPTEADRLKHIISCDKIVVLPGGTGTLEELIYANETLRSREHTAQVYLVNIDGFYDGILKQIKTNMQQGFSNEKTIKFETVKGVEDLDFLQSQKINNK